MTPRRRRGVLLLVLAAAGAIGVFVAVSSYVSSVRKQVSPKVTVLSLRRDVNAQDEVTLADVRSVSVPQRYAPSTALRDAASFTGQVAASDLEAGSILQKGMLRARPQLEPGQRELAIEVNADTGVAGKISPNAIVDIQATFPGDDKSPPRSKIIVPHARVVTVGTVKAGTDRPGPSSSQNSGGANGLPSGGGGTGGNDQVVPVTFALTPKEALIVGYAESFAQEVRLSLIREGDNPKKTNYKEYTLPPARGTG